MQARDFCNKLLVGFLKYRINELIFVGIMDSFYCGGDSPWGLFVSG